MLDTWSQTPAVIGFIDKGKTLLVIEYHLTVSIPLKGMEDIILVDVMNVTVVEVTDVVVGLKRDIATGIFL